MHAYAYMCPTNAYNIVLVGLNTHKHTHIHVQYTHVYMHVYMIHIVYVICVTIAKIFPHYWSCHLKILLKRVSMRIFDVSFVVSKTVKQTVEVPVTWDAMILMLRHCNGVTHRIRTKWKISIMLHVAVNIQAFISIWKYVMTSCESV